MKFKCIIAVLITLFLSACSDKSTDINTQKTTFEAPSPISKTISGKEEIPSKELLSSFSTKIYTKTKSRMNNLKIVASKLNGYVIEANEKFSYNNTCGPYDKAHGFGKATIFVNSKEVQGYGGGVCQVSSTLYNAVKNLNVEILERHNHAKPVYYVPINKDATVSYGSLDFKFRNLNSYPLEIGVEISNNNVTVSIYKKSI